MFFSKDKSKRVIKYLMLISIALLCFFMSISYAEEATWETGYHPEGWIGTEGWWNPPDRRGCYMSVYNTRTGKYAVGVYNRLWPDNLTIDATSDESYKVGDTLNCYAYTSYSGGTYWIYKDGVLVKSEQAGTTPDHFEFTVTITSRTTKVSCSASAQSRNGEELSVTIIAAGDFEKPVITLDSEYVAVGSYVHATVTDNDAVASWGVSTSSIQEPPRYIPVNQITSPISINASFQVEGTYYMFAKDRSGNVSEPVRFYLGNPPQPATRIVDGQEEVISPYDVQVREGDDATFSISATGAAPLSFQWYTNTSNSTTGGTIIEGATNSTYTISSAQRNLDGKYYYCKITNNFGSAYSRVAKLTIYYAPVLATITGNDIIHGGSYTLNLVIQTDGNTDNYTYQWFKASSSGGAGSRIIGATDTQYVVTPTTNSTDWYYCEVYNNLPGGGTLYITRSNYAKVVSDVSKPTIEIGEISNDIVINKDGVVTVPVIVREQGEGYEETNPATNLTSSDIDIYVGGRVQNSAVKVIHYVGQFGEDYKYNVDLSNVTGDGFLSLNFVTNAVKDKLGNRSAQVTHDTSILIDNTNPVISLYELIDGYSTVYINKNGTLNLNLAVEDAGKYKTNSFDSGDISLTAGGVSVGTFSRTLGYDTKINNKYIYNLILGNIDGDGIISVVIPAGKVEDDAGNKNVSTTIPLKTMGNQDIIADNTKPIITSLDARLENYTSTKIYPSNLDSWHDGWAKEDIYITINASDKIGAANGIIDHYLISMDNGISYSKLTNNRNVISNNFNGNVWYKACDKAGNESEPLPIAIKIDKTDPIDTPIGLYELRRNGADYVYKEDYPVNKTIHIYPKTPQDNGDVKSGVKINRYSGSNYISYYTLTHYSDKSKNTIISGPVTYNFEPDGSGNMTAPDPLTEDGYYEIIVTTTDIAGNQVVSEPHKIYIRKHADNTIRIKNISDIGSGPKKLTINVYKADSDGNKTFNKAIDEIVVKNPYKEYSTTVGLGRGTFYVTARIDDSVGNYANMEQKIVNDF